MNRFARRCFNTSSTNRTTTAKGGLSGPSIAGRKRFYKIVSVVPAGKKEGYQITLDDRRLRTPMRNELILPTKELAHAIALEWDSQRDEEGGIRPTTMPLMSLAATSIDNTFTSDEIVEELIRYLQTDTLCYPVSKSHSKLHRLQTKTWTPIRESIEKKFKSPIYLSNGTISAVSHPPETIENIKSFLYSLTPIQLTAVRCITRECKSLTLGLALFFRIISVDEAMNASRVEEEYQIENWGMVEGGHDIDRVNVKVGIASASSFLWLSTLS